MIGNSSSGLTEAPSCNLPVINIGDRQKGRIIPENVLSAGRNINEIISAIEEGLTAKFYNDCKKVTNPYGDGQTALKIKNILLNIDINKCKNSKKGFFSI